MNARQQFSLLNKPDLYVVLVLIILGCVSVSLHKMIFYFTTDDAFISFRYVERFLVGKGLTFNDGEYVEGFSNPLWVFLLIGLKQVTGISVVMLSKLLGYAVTLLTFLMFWIMAKNVMPVYASRVFLSAGLMLFITPSLHVYAPLGLEAPLLMLLLTAGMALTLKAVSHTPKKYDVCLLIAALMFGLVGVTRPEGILYAFLWWIGLTLWLLWFLPFSQVVWRVFGAGLIAVLPAAAYEIFRLHYYSAWVPNTAIAKVRGQFGDLPFVSEWCPWVPPLFLMLCLVLALFFAMKRSDENNAESSLLPMLLFAPPVVAGMIFAFYAGTDWMMFGRFIFPFWPLVVFPLCVALEYLFIRSDLSQWGRTVLRSIMLGGSFCSWLIVAAPFIGNEGLAPSLMRGADASILGRWIADSCPQPLTIATKRLGAVSYYGERHTYWDILGLTDRTQAMALRQAYAAGKTQEEVIMQINKDMILRRKPDLVLVAKYPKLNLSEPDYTPEDQKLLEGYNFIKRFKEGKAGNMDVWQRRDRPTSCLTHGVQGAIDY